MKLEELSQTKKGTYAAVQFSEQTQLDLKQYMDDNNIPNSLGTSKLHTTLLYSRKYLPNYEAAGEYAKPMTGTATGFDVWKSSPDDSGDVTNCLVLEYKCPELEARHKELMKEHGATYDYPEYKTHITLSYNAGDLDISELPPFTADIEIVNEYKEDLNLSWAKENS